uniref:S9 family peptidase n=1 Tax=Ningiella ruwaisensis TaxID=2364274 RepID=UPI001F4FD8AD|nr:S9 family peptidase [Ningiella ruwaisensis]
MQSPALSGHSPKNIKLSPDGKRVTFTRGKESDQNRYDLWEYHIASGKTQLLFDSDDLHTGEEALSDEEKARRERMRVYGSGIIDYQWSSDGNSLLFPLAGDVYYFQLGQQQAIKLVDTPEFETDIKFSPKGNYISFIREQNLYAMDIETKQEIAITSQGGGDIKMGMAEFVAQEEMSRMTGYWWSPDEQHIAFTKVDESSVLTITRSEIYADSIKMIEQKYPKAGTNNVNIELGLKQIEKTNQQLTVGDTSWIELGENADIYLARVKWKNPSNLTYQVQSRNQQQLTLMNYSLANEQTTVLINESSPTWLNLHDDLLFLENGQFIWASEKDGYKHLYLHDASGEIITQLTEGSWVVDRIRGFHQASQMLFFEGRLDTPLEKHIYALNVETARQSAKSATKISIKRLSEAGFYHDASFSDDASIFVNKRSNINTPPQVAIYNKEGEMLEWLEQNEVNDDHPLKPYMQAWIKPSFGTIKAQDGTDLYYRLYTPRQRTDQGSEQKSDKRPAIVYLYGGPLAQMVTNQWAGKRGLLMQHWVNKGYVVFTLNNRGSNYRGKAFEDHLYQKMGFVEVDDQVAGVEFLHSLEYVDANNIGVYGHSYGGYMALMAMFKAPDYFAAGVAGAPVTDWRLYDTHYTERYMGDPREVDDAYTASSVFPYAKNLKGDLLIYHGMADDNVLFTHSTKLYKHLQDLAIPFHTMDYPGKKHSIRGTNTGIHLYHTITNFFDTHLDN